MLRPNIITKIESSGPMTAPELLSVIGLPESDKNILLQCLNTMVKENTLFQKQAYFYVDHQLMQLNARLCMQKMLLPMLRSNQNQYFSIAEITSWLQLRNPNIVLQDVADYMDTLLMCGKIVISNLDTYKLNAAFERRRMASKDIYRSYKKKTYRKPIQSIEGNELLINNITTCVETYGPVDINSVIVHLKLPTDSKNVVRETLQTMIDQGTLYCETNMYFNTSQRETVIKDKIINSEIVKLLIQINFFSIVIW